jgi:hypothetical protein
MLIYPKVLLKSYLQLPVIVFKIFDDSGIRYELLGELLNQYGEDILFINDYCYSGSSIELFKAVDFFPQGSIITSTNGDELGQEEIFVPILLHAMRKRRPFRRKRIGHEKTEMMIVDADELYLTQPDVTDDESLLSLPGTEYIRYRNPRLINNSPVQYPQRYGRTLDTMVYAAPGMMKNVIVGKLDRRIKIN